MLERYMEGMIRVEKLIQKKLVWRGLANSTAQSVPYFMYALAMYYSTYLIATKEMHFKNVIK